MRRPDLRAVAPTALLVLVFAAGGWALWSRREDLGDALSRLTPGAVLLSGALALLAVLAMLMSWAASVREGAPSLGARDLARVYLVGQMGKYLPGSVWPVLAQSALARRRGASASAVATGSLLNLALTVAVSLAVGGALLPLAPDEAVDQLWWAPFVLVPFVVVLHPRVLGLLLPLASRAMRRGEPSFVPTGPGIVRASAWAVAGSLLFGAHLYVLVDALGGGGLRGLALTTCAYNLAVAAGVIVIFVPAGAGVREAVLTAVLAPVLDVPTALAAALVSRATLIVLDLGLGALQVRGLKAWAAADE